MKMNFLNLRTKSLAKGNRTTRATTPFKQATTVGVLFTVEDKKKHYEIKEFVHLLERNGKKVQVFSFLPDNTDNYEFLFDFFTVKDISFWGNIISGTAEKFYNSPFDYLYYMDTTPNPILLNIMARSKAKCRIGRHWENGRPYFELMIDTVSNSKSLFETIYKYSTQLK